MQSGPKNTAKILTLDRCGDRAGGPSFLLRTLHEISGFHFLEPQPSFSGVPVFVQSIKPRQTLISTTWTLHRPSADLQDRKEPPETSVPS